MYQYARLLKEQWKVAIHVLDTFTVETPTANRGPNAVSVICFKGCWSTIRSRPHRFDSCKMFSVSDSNFWTFIFKFHAYKLCYYSSVLAVVFTAFLLSSSVLLDLLMLFLTTFGLVQAFARFSSGSLDNKANVRQGHEKSLIRATWHNLKEEMKGIKTSCCLTLALFSRVPEENLAKAQTGQKPHREEH